MSIPVQYSWQPSVRRVVYLDAFPCQARGYIPPVLPPSWPAKDPGDTLDFVADFRDALIGNNGDSISGLSVQISPANPGDLNLVSSSVDGTLAILWFSSGFPGTIYQVTTITTTNSGRVISRTINLPVVALATPPVPDDAITDQAGAPITDQYGAPITAD